jgi:transcriptional regulator with XRE-family HTH domain
VGTEGTLKREFAKRLAAEINKQGWNGSELARRASKYAPVTRDNVSNYLNAAAIAGPTKLVAMAKALNVTPTDLLPSRPRDPAAAASPLQMRDLGNGTAQLTIDRVVPYRLALDVLNLLGASTNTDDEDKNGGHHDSGPRRRVSGHR